MPYSPKQRQVTRNTGHGSESPSQKSGIVTSSTAAAMASPPDLAQQEWGLSADVMGRLLDSDIVTPEVADWTTTARTTAADYSHLMATWFKKDPVVQTYALGLQDGEQHHGTWEDMRVNTWFLKDQLDAQWNPGSVFFDLEASFNAMGAPLGTGWYCRRLFWNAKRGCVHAPMVLLRQFEGQEFAEHPMVCGCLDDVLACAGIESVGAFTAWLSVSPVLPVPVNTTLLAKIRLAEVPTEPGKKATKTKKIMISLDLVRPNQDKDQEDVVYVRAEGLFVRPATGGFDLRRFEAFGPMVAHSSQPLWGMGDIRDRAEAILREQLEVVATEGDEDAARSAVVVKQQLDEAKAQRAVFMSLMKDETSGEGILVRVPNAEALEARWLETHPIFRQIPTLLTAPADPLPGYEYLTGGALLRFSYQQPEQSASRIGEEAEQEDGHLCVVGAAHFLPPVEGPPGLAHGGSIYGVFENLFGQALAALSPAAKQQPGPVMKVQYKGQLPLNGTYRLECRVVCSSQEGQQRQAGAKTMLRGSLKSLDGQTVYNSAEAALPEGIFFADDHPLSSRNSMLASFGRACAGMAGLSRL
jgi:hypothetical protein